MDITKCEGTNCPIKENCYKYLAPSKEEYQYYYVTPPFKEDGTCDHKWTLICDIDEPEGTNEC